jgi:hypothetical protein
MWDLSGVNGGEEGQRSKMTNLSLYAAMVPFLANELVHRIMISVLVIM